MSENEKKQLSEADEKKKAASKRFWGKLACTLLAILMWIYVSYDENPTSTNTYTNIPVTVTGIAELESRNITVLSSELSIAVKISGARNTLSKLNKSDINAIVDVSNITGTGVQTPLISIAGIPDSLSVEEKKITSGALVTDSLIRKTVEVGIDITGTMSENIIEGEKSVFPSQISVKGPSTLLESISAWTEPVDVSNITKSENIYNTGIVLKDASGAAVTSEMITKSDNEATITVNCLAKKEIPVNSPDVVGSLSGYDVVVENVEPQTVTVVGPVEAVEKITAVDLDEIDAYYAMSAKSFTREIKLPDDIECETAYATVTVSIVSNTEEENEEL